MQSTLQANRPSVVGHSARIQELLAAKAASRSEPNRVLAFVQPSIVFLNGMGHVEIKWSPANAERVKALIEKKMAEGVRFFIIKSKMFGLIKNTTLITSIDQVQDGVAIDEEDLSRLGVTAQQIRVHDPELSALAESGVIRFERRDEKDRVEQIGIAKTVQEVLTNRTVAAPRLVGG